MCSVCQCYVYDDPADDDGQGMYDGDSTDSDWVDHGVDSDEAAYLAYLALTDEDDVDTLRAHYLSARARYRYYAGKFNRRQVSSFQPP